MAEQMPISVFWLWQRYYRQDPVLGAKPAITDPEAAAAIMRRTLGG